jgi:hypothetical protein
MAEAETGVIDQVERVKGTLRKVLDTIYENIIRARGFIRRDFDRGLDLFRRYFAYEIFLGKRELLRHRNEVREGKVYYFIFEIEAFL